MALHPSTRGRFMPVSELVVPTIMVGTVGLYLYGSWGLSRAALLFPVSLMVVIMAAVSWTLFAAAVWRNVDGKATADDEIKGPLMGVLPWSLVGISAIIVLIQDRTGALFALLAIAFATQMVFTRTKPLQSLAVAVGITLPVYVLFKYVLYVRFPAGILGIG